MNILVTGATGFIGRHLVKRLSGSDNNIICLVRNTKKAKFLRSLGIKLIFADISSNIQSSLLPNRIDVVFHCAGYVGSDKDRLYKSNVLGTENICRLAYDLQVRRMVYISSIAVVSGNNKIPMIEDLPFKATNIYGESKIEAEKKVLQYREKGLNAVILRPCLIYGEDEPHFLKKLFFLLKYRLLPLIDNGRYKWHLVYIENVIDSMLFSLSREEFLKGAFFVADKEVLTIKEIMLVLSKAINAHPAWNMPALFKPLLFYFPYFGRILRLFFKDRIYCLDKIVSLGFKHSYSIRPYLFKSAFAVSRQTNT